MTDVNEQILEELRYLRQDLKEITDDFDRLNEIVSNREMETKDYYRRGLDITCESNGISAIAAIISCVAMWFASAALILQIYPWMNVSLIVCTIGIAVLAIRHIVSIKKENKKRMSEINEVYSP